MQALIERKKGRDREHNDSGMILDRLGGGGGKAYLQQTTIETKRLREWSERMTTARFVQDK